MATKEKHFWILVIFLLSGLVIGGLLGQLAAEVDFLWWLDYGESFGLTAPLELDLNIIKLTVFFFSSLLYNLCIEKCIILAVVDGTSIFSF